MPFPAILGALLSSAIGPLIGLASGPPGYDDLPAPLRRQAALSNQASTQSLQRGMQFENEARSYATSAGQNAQQAGSFDPASIEGLSFLAPIVEKYQGLNLFQPTRSRILTELLPQTTAFTNPVINNSPGQAASLLQGAQGQYAQGIGQGVSGVSDILSLYFLQKLFGAGSPIGGGIA